MSRSHHFLFYLCSHSCPASSLHCFPFLFVFLSLLFHFLPHMWFCSSSLCTLFLPLLHCHPSLTYGFSLWVCVCLVLPRVQWGSPLICMCVLQTTIERWRVCMSAGLWACLCGVQQVMQQFPNDPQMRQFTLLVSLSFVLRSTKYTTGGSNAGFGPRTLICLGNCWENWLCFQQGDRKICVLAVAGAFFAMGLVDLPGRLWETNMQVPESQPSHRLGPSGQVSSVIFESSQSLIFHTFIKIAAAGRNLTSPSLAPHAVREMDGVHGVGPWDSNPGRPRCSQRG